MKRNLITTLSLAVMSVMLNVAAVHAQSYAKANVPFAFSVGSKQLPAGTYEVKVLSKTPCEIMIENGETGAAAVSIARRENPGNESKLVFHRVDNQYFLSEVWNDSGAGGLIVPTSKHERELTNELRLAKNPSGGNESVAIALK
jgi:hypothetical protein